MEIYLNVDLPFLLRFNVGVLMVLMKHLCHSSLLVFFKNIITCIPVPFMFRPIQCDMKKGNFVFHQVVSYQLFLTFPDEQSLLKARFYYQIIFGNKNLNAKLLLSLSKIKTERISKLNSIKFPQS